MEIRYKNSIDNLVELNMDIYEKDSVIQRRVNLKHIVVPIFIIIFFLVTSRHKISIPFLIFCLILMSIWIIFYPKIAKEQYKSLVVKRLSNLNLDDIEQTLIIDNSGITQRNKNKVIEIAWENVEEIRDMNTNVFIDFRDLSTIIIPSSAFKNEEEKRILLEIINKNIKK